MAQPNKLKVNDKVKRITGMKNVGVIKDIRSEVTATSQEAKDKGLLVQVQWDNGTLSYLGPEGLEVVKD